MPSNPLLVRSIRHLASVCDGAQALDGQGFSGLDSAFGKSLASQADRWSAKQELVAWKLASRYKGQLMRAGIDFSTIPKPAEVAIGVTASQAPRREQAPMAPLAVAPKPLFSPTMQARVLRRASFGYVFTFPYNADLVAMIKANFRSAFFDREGKWGWRNGWHVDETFETLTKIPNFCEANGFNMDSEAKKVVEETLAAIEDRIKYSSSTTADLHIDGLGGTLYPYQAAGVSYMIANPWSINGDEMGCIDGEAKIRINRAAKGSAIKLSVLYQRFNGIGTYRWRKDIPTFARALCDGELRLHRIKKVLAKGRKSVVKLTLVSGKTLRCTPDHEIALDDGTWSPAGKLFSGSRVLTNGKPICKDCGKAKDVITYRLAKFRGVCRSCMYRKKLIPKVDTIVSVSFDGEADVFDIVMEDPHRNFVANGVVVHNCGKTVMGLASILAVKAQRSLVVCPASLKITWSREAQRWLPNHEVVVFSGRKAIATPLQSTGPTIYVINYDLLGGWQETLKIIKPDAIIFDEFHRLKSYRALRTVAAKSIVIDTNPNNLWMLSGTPVLNRPGELTSPLDILGMLPHFGGLWKFREDFCFNERTGGFDGARNTAILNQKLRAIGYQRRLKKDVLTELPPKTRSFITVEIDNAAEYQKAQRNVVNFIKERTFEETVASGASEEDAQQKARERGESAAQADILVQINTLRQLAAKGKLAAACEWIEDFLESDSKLVIFAHHNSILDVLVEKLKDKNPAILRGGMTDKAKQNAVDLFQNNPECRVFIGSLTTAGEGITLTAASNVAFIEYGWSPSVHDQCEDRTHRVGQKDNVTAWYIQAKDTIDEDMLAIIEEKRRVVTSVHDGAPITDDRSIVSELLRRMKNK